VIIQIWASKMGIYLPKLGFLPENRGDSTREIPKMGIYLPNLGIRWQGG